MTLDIIEYYTKLHKIRNWCKEMLFAYHYGFPRDMTEIEKEVSMIMEVVTEELHRVREAMKHE
jgi:hypothetical protein